MATAIPTDVHLTAEQRRQIDQLCAYDGRTRAEVISQALDEYLAIHEPRTEEARLAEHQRVLDETFGIAPDFPYPDRCEPDRFDGDWNRNDR